jgi:ribosome-associated protein
MTDQNPDDGDDGNHGSDRKRTRGRSDPARPARGDGDDERPPLGGDESGKAGALRALELALDKKALEPVLLDVRGLCTYCNYQLVLSGRSDRQVEAIAQAIVVGLKASDIRPLSHEGRKAGQWALLDFGDFVVHVFHHPQREHYDLEGLWVDAPRVAIEVPADARVPVDQAY